MNTTDLLKAFDEGALIVEIHRRGKHQVFTNEAAKRANFTAANYSALDRRYTELLGKCDKLEQELAEAREKLEQPVGSDEPVAWANLYFKGTGYIYPNKPEAMTNAGYSAKESAVPLYRRPQRNPNAYWDVMREVSRCVRSVLNNGSCRYNDLNEVLERELGPIGNMPDDYDSIPEVRLYPAKILECADAMGFWVHESPCYNKARNELCRLIGLPFDAEVKPSPEPVAVAPEGVKAKLANEIAVHRAMNRYPDHAVADRLQEIHDGITELPEVDRFWDKYISGSSQCVTIYPPTGRNLVIGGRGSVLDFIAALLEKANAK